MKFIQLILTALWLALLLPAAAQAATLGVHTFSYHDQGNFNNNNFGAYLEHKGWTGGFYKNSLNKDSVYAAYSAHWALPENPLFQSAAIMAGIVTGYQSQSYDQATSPIVAFSLKHDFNQQHGLRLSALPANSKSPANFVLHLSYEFNFK